ncbi:MAG: HypC/HybG/HupF family hydrogenase formation chaperone [Ilumatobacteraceae bacterium]
MCVGIPARVVTINQDKMFSAIVDVEGVRREANVALLDDPNDPLREGDWVLLHVGFAMSKLDEAEAKSTLEFIRSLGSVYDEEVDALRDQNSA